MRDNKTVTYGSRTIEKIYKDERLLHLSDLWQDRAGIGVQIIVSPYRLRQEKFNRKQSYKFV